MRPKKWVLTFKVVKFPLGSYVHEFQWLNAHKIGWSIMFVCELLVHHNKVVLDKKTLRIEVQHHQQKTTEEFIFCSAPDH